MAGEDWVIDTESDGLLDAATRIWCICMVNLQTRETRSYYGDTLEEGVQVLREANSLTCHNILGHDLPLLKKLYGGEFPSKINDTLVLSRLLNADRGGHSIADWGKRLGQAKPAHEDWTQFSPEMLHRCEEDAMIGTKVLFALVEEAGDMSQWQAASKLSHAAAELQSRVEDRGVGVHRGRMFDVMGRLTEAFDKEFKAMESKLPCQVKQLATVSKPFKLNGEPTALAAKWADGAEICGPFTKVEFKPFNLASPKQVLELLFSIGYKPDAWNLKNGPDGKKIVSSPKVTDTALAKVDHPIASHLLQYRVLKHRLGMLNTTKKNGEKTGWYNNLRKDGRLTAGAIVNATNTGRYAHRGIVNVPAVHSEWGQELRSILVPSGGMIFAGTDASGLEARVAAHVAADYDDGEFAREVMNGDVHQKNADAFANLIQQEVTRDQAKPFFYGILYGASGGKLATMMGVSEAFGDNLKKTFWKTNPGLKAANDEAQKEARSRGYVVVLGSRKLWCRSPHSALNVRLQGTGAMLMMEYFVRVGAPDLPWWMVGHFHDESLIELTEDHKELYLETVSGIGKNLTKKFDLTCPLEFDTSFGGSYDEVH